MSRVKRVRFAEPDRASEGCCQQDAYVDPVESSIPQNFDKAKTSEYQYYQELQQAAGHKVHSRLPHKLENHLNKTKADNSDRLKTSVSEKSGCSFHLVLVNKQDSNLKKIDFGMGEVDDSETFSYQYLKKSQEDNFHNLLSHPPHAQDNCLKKTAASSCTVELQYKRGEVFSRKRQKLLKLAAEVLSLDADDFSSDRSNLIAKFLQRLGIGKNVNNNSGLLRFKQMEFDTCSTKLSYPESLVHVQEVPDSTKTFLMPSTSVGIKGRDLHECWVEANNLIFLPGNDLDGHHYSDKIDCSYWADSSHETSPPYRSNQSDYALDGWKTTNWQTKRSSILGSNPSTELSFSGMLENCPVEFDNPVNKILLSPGYSLKHAIGPSNSPCFRELDENYGLHKPKLVRKKSPLVLDGKDGILVNEPSLFVSCRRVSQALNPLGYNHWNSNCDLDEANYMNPMVYNHWNSDWDSDEANSWYPSFFPKKQPLNSALRELLVDWIPNSTAGKCPISDPSFLLEESEHYPLISSNVLNDLNSIEGSGLSNNYKESDHGIFVHKSFQGKLYSSSPLPRIDLNVRWKDSSRNVCFWDNYPLSHARLQFDNNEEDMSKYKQIGNELHSVHTWSNNDSNIHNISHQISLCKESLFPLLLDISSWDNEDREII